MSGLFGSSSNTTSNTASNQATNSATNFATQAQQATASNTAQQYGQNTAQQSGPVQAALNLINANSGPISSSAIGNYMSPYLNQVVNATMAQNAQSNAVQQQALKGNAISQGALGGDRSQVAMAELMRGQGLNNASTIANLYNTGYGQALTAAQADRLAALQAAGMMGTQGSTSTAGMAGSSTAGTTQALTQGTQNTAQASALSGNTNSTTTSNPGMGGMMMAGLSLMRDGGRVPRLADGGFIIPNGGVPAGFGTLPPYVPLTYQPPQSGQGQGQQSQGQQSLTKLAQQARSGLGNLINTTGGDGTTAQLAADTSATSSMGDSGLGAIAGKGSGGAVRGYGPGGTVSSMANTVPGPVQATMPNISMPVAQMPTMAAMPAMTPLSVAMPSVPFPTVPQASAPSSGGKGSGGAVRGYAQGGSARRPFEDGGDTSLPPGWLDNQKTDVPLQLAEDAPSTGMAQLAYAPAALTPAQNINNWLAAKTGEANTPYPAETGGRSANDLFQSADTLPNAAPAAAPVPEPPQAPGLGGLTQSVTQPSPAFDAETLGPSSPFGETAPYTPEYGKTSNPFLISANAPQGQEQGIGALSAPQAASANAAPSAVPVTAPPAPLVGRQAVAGSIRDELKAAGASDNAIRGIMANVKDESNFDPTLRHPDQPKWSGEAHYAHGLYQEGGAEWNNYQKWLDENHTGADWRDPKLQTQFLAQNLKEHYPDVWKQMNEGTPAEAAQAFVSGYLKPAAQYEQSRRDQYAQGVPDIGHYLTQAAGSVKSGVSSAAQGVTGAVADLGAGLKNMVSKGFNNSPDQAQHALKGPDDQASGGLLSRVFGMNFNPLNLTQKERMTMLSVAAGMMQPGGNLGTGLAAGINYQNARTQQDRQAALDSMKINLEMAKLGNLNAGKVEKIRDASGAERLVLVDPRTGKASAVDVGGGAKGTSSDMESIPMNVSGDDFIQQAKQLGYSSADLDIANQAANYKANPNQLVSIRGERRGVIERLAARINPDYDMAKYPAVAAAEKSLASGPGAKATGSIGRLFDEVEVASGLADQTHNSKYEAINRLSGESYPSGSEYGVAIGKLGTALNNVTDTAAAVAKGGGQGAEGDAKRRGENMSKYQAPEALKGALVAEAEIGLKNGQSNLTAYNTAHGYTPDNPKYKTIMDYLTPAQQRKATAMLGADKIEDITGKPVTGHGAAPQTQAAPPIPTEGRPTGMSNIQLRDMAAQRIQQGYDKGAINQRLQSWGISPL